MKKIFLMVAVMTVGAFAHATDFDKSKEIHCAVGVGGYNEIQKFSLGATEKDGRRSLLDFERKLHQGACVEIAEHIQCQVFRGLIEYRIQFKSKNISVSGGQLSADMLIKKTFARTHEGRCTQASYTMK